MSGKPALLEVKGKKWERRIRKSGHGEK